MGLDMYLTKKIYVENWDHLKDQRKVIYTVGDKEIKLNNPQYIIDEVAYWRKANQIHGWFVENCQGGLDNCQESHVTIDQLLELVDTCKKVLTAVENSPKGTISVKSGFANGEPTYREQEVYILDDVAKALLPPTQGFFFGGDEIDDWYIENLKYTIKSIEESLGSDIEGDYYYQASW